MSALREGARRAGGSNGIQAQWAMLGKECSTASVAFSRLTTCTPI